MKDLFIGTIKIVRRIVRSKAISNARRPTFFEKLEAKKFDSVNLPPSLHTTISPKIRATVNRAALPVTIR